MKTHQILTAVAALALVAGCSSGKKAAKATPAPRVDVHTMMLQVARCARAHGAPNFPDPIVDSKGNWDFPLSAERQPKTPVCDAIVDRWKLANPKNAPPPVSPQDLVKLKDYAACMRQQGLPDWPDPTPDGIFKLPPRLTGGPKRRFEKQDKVCFPKAPKSGINVDGSKGR